MSTLKMKIITCACLLVLFIGSGSGQVPEYPEYDENELLTFDTDNKVPEVPPGRFYGTPADLLVEEGESVEFDCTGNSSHVLMIQKNDLRNPNGNPVIVMTGSNKIYPDARLSVQDGFFHIDGVNRKDSGYYRCVFQGSSDSVNLTHKLEVEYAPVINPERREVTVKLGEPLRVGCRAFGNPKPTISWPRIAGEAVEGTLQAGFSLQYPAAERSNAGEYECLATNSVGEANGTRTVVVRYAPAVSMPEEINTGEGQTVQLNCTVHAVPSATVQWFHNKEPVAADTQAVAEMTDEGHIHTMTIPTVARQNYGQYTCKADNEMGTMETQSVVTDLPSMPVLEDVVESFDNGSYAISWIVNSFYDVTSYAFMYRAKADEGAPQAEWELVNIAKDQVKEVTREGNERHFSHLFLDLDRTVEDYELSGFYVNNTRGRSPKAEEEFSLKITTQRKPSASSGDNAQAAPQSTEETTDTARPTGAATSTTLPLALIAMSALAALRF